MSPGTKSTKGARASLGKCPRCGRRLALRVGLSKTGRPYNYLGCSNAVCEERETASLRSGIVAPSARQKRYTPEESIAALRFVAGLVQEGERVLEACRICGISHTVYYQWREKYGALVAWRPKPMREASAGNDGAD